MENHISFEPFSHFGYAQTLYSFKQFNILGKKKVLQLLLTCLHVSVYVDATHTHTNAHPQKKGTSGMCHRGNNEVDCVRGQ